jgi:hypothetical protein
MGLSAHILRQLWDVTTRRHRDPHGDHKVDCITQQVTLLHSRAVPSSGLPSLNTRIATLLECRCPTQCAEVRGSSCPVIADGVAGDQQCGAAERYDDSDNSGHQYGCAAPLRPLRPHGTLHRHGLIHHPQALGQLVREPPAGPQPAIDPTAGLSLVPSP